MTASSIIQIILGFLKLANFLFGWLHDQKLIKATEDRLIAAALIKMKERSTTLKEIDARFAKMSDKDIINEIDKHGDFRD